MHDPLGEVFFQAHNLSICLLQTKRASFVSNEEGGTSQKVSKPKTGILRNQSEPCLRLEVPSVFHQPLIAQGAVGLEKGCEVGFQAPGPFWSLLQTAAQAQGRCYLTREHRHAPLLQDDGLEKQTLHSTRFETGKNPLALNVI